MARRNVDWNIGWWTDSEIGFNNSQVIYELISDQQLEVYEDDCIVERVVGQYLIANVNTSDSLLMHIRLCVRPEGTSGPFAATIRLFEMADEQFMWHKTILIPPASTNLFPGAHPEWSHLDCRVNRKLEGRDRLCLIFEPDNAVLNPATAANFQIAHWMRVLVKT